MVTVYSKQTAHYSKLSQKQHEKISCEKIVTSKTIKDPSNSAQYNRKSGIIQNIIILPLLFWCFPCIRVC